MKETLQLVVNGSLQNVPAVPEHGHAYTYNIEGRQMTSVTYPETCSWNHSGDHSGTDPGPDLHLFVRRHGRPAGLKDQNNNTAVNNVTYNPANQLLTFNTETHTYNNLNQMTRLTVTRTAPLDISYNFPAGPTTARSPRRRITSAEKR